MLEIDKLWVMQQSIRDLDQISGMIEYVEGGGLWTMERITEYAAKKGKTAYPIYITIFPDNEKMIHDGHHRILANFLGGRHELYDSEFVIKPWTYESYNEVAVDRGFVTPFDPKTECRTNDFLEYKNKVLAMAKIDLVMAEAYVWANKAKYSEPRVIYTVAELAENYRIQNKKVA